MKIETKVQAAKLKLSKEQKLLITSWLEGADGQDVVFQLTRRRRVRSLPQNSYMHFCFQLISDHTGYTPEEAKGICKFMFGIKRTSELSTIELEEFLSKVRAWASMELGCYLPLPNEASFLPANYETQTPKASD